MKNEKFYISTAIAYSSGKPHVGNVYEIVMADVIARYKKLCGYDVYFQTGADEHGIKIENNAKLENKSPQEYVDEISGQIKEIWDGLNVDYNKFIRTTNEKHKIQVKKIFKKLYDQGDIYKSNYEGWYCVPCESFFTDTQLNEGKCPDCGREVKLEKEEAYFFKLSKYQDFLIDLYNKESSLIEPVSRKNEMMKNFILDGVQDLCVSRTTFDWGVRVDFDPKHVVYVWIDALSNYITFLGYDVDGNHSEEFKKYWPCDVHLIGKDILRFHSIYWPVLLKALDLELPHKIFAHPWFMMNFDKMSKSKGNLIYSDDLIKFFGVDAVRYYLISEMPYLNDGNISYELCIEKINSDLANTLGNLVNRTIAMQNKYFDGIICAYNEKEEIDNELIEMVISLKIKVEENINNYKVGAALSNIIDVFRRCNKYIDETTPWILAKDPEKQKRLGTVLYNLLESIRISTVLLYPFMPETSKNIFKQLNTEKTNFESINTFGGLNVGDKVGEGNILFERIDANKKMDEINKYLNEKI